MTRSSSTAELVALTDMADYALSMAEFLVEQGLAFNSPVLMQENQSVLKIFPSNGKTLQERKSDPVGQGTLMPPDPKSGLVSHCPLSTTREDKNWYFCCKTTSKYSY